MKKVNVKGLIGTSFFFPGIQRKTTAESREERKLKQQKYAEEVPLLGKASFELLIELLIPQKFYVIYYLTLNS